MSFNLIEKQVIYRGEKLRLEVHHLEDEDGRRHHREVVAHPGAVVVLPWLDDKYIVLIRNYRYAVGQLLHELPAGTMEKGEDPINCAGRELVEETGYLAGRLRSLLAFFASPGVTSERIYAYGAYDLERSQPSPEVGEQIEVVPTPFDEALEMVRRGEIQDAKTIATLLWFERFGKADVRSEI